MKFLSFAVAAFNVLLSFPCIAEEGGSSGIEQKFIEIEGISLPKAEALDEMARKLGGSPQMQVEALSALATNPSVVKGTPLLGLVESVALTPFDTSALERFARDSENSAEPKTPSSDILLLGTKAQIRQLALYIAVANGSMKAFEAVATLEQSKSLVDQIIVEKAARWKRFRGTPDAPKPGPVVMNGRILPVDEFEAEMTKMLSSTDKLVQRSAIEIISTNLDLTGSQNVEIRDRLETLLGSYIKMYRNSTDEFVNNQRINVLRVLWRTGGRVAEEILKETSADQNPAVSREALVCLKTFSHERKP